MKGPTSMLHWFSELFSHPSLTGALIIAGKTTIVYLFLVVGLRLMGKRELGQMNIYDLVLIIVLANAVQNAMVGDDNSLVGGIVAALTLLILNRIFTAAISSSPRLEGIMVGQPMLILNEGHLIEDRMRREGITREQVMAALREHGLCSFDEVRMAVLECDGSISVVPMDADVRRTRRHFKALRTP